MFDKIKLNKLITITVALMLLIVSSAVTGVNLITIQLLSMAAIGTVVLVGIQMLLLNLKEQHKNIVIKILIWIVVLLIIVAVVNFIIEYTTDSILIFRKTIPGLIVFVYASVTLILSFLLVDRYIKQKKLYIALQSIVICLVIVLGIYDVLLSVLGGASVTEVNFEDPDVTLYLIEDSFLFSSNHQLYKKEFTFYGSYLEHDGSWSCNNGCVLRTPEAYTWTWVDDNTLIVSYGSIFEDVIYYLPE